MYLSRPNCVRCGAEFTFLGDPGPDPLCPACVPPGRVRAPGRRAVGPVLRGNAAFLLALAILVAGAVAGGIALLRWHTEQRVINEQVRQQERFWELIQNAPAGHRPHSSPVQTAP